MALPVAGGGKVQGVEGAISFCLPKDMAPITQLQEWECGHLLGVLADGGIVAWNGQT